MVAEITNILLILPAGGPANSQDHGQHRNTQGGIPDTPKHLCPAPDKTTQPQPQDSDKNNQQAMLDTLAPLILVPPSSGLSTRSPHPQDMRPPAPLPTRALPSRATGVSRTRFPNQGWRERHHHAERLGPSLQYFMVELPILGAQSTPRISTNTPAQHPRSTPRNPPSDTKDKPPPVTRCSSPRIT